MERLFQKYKMSQVRHVKHVLDRYIYQIHQLLDNQRQKENQSHYIKQYLIVIYHEILQKV